MVCGGVGMEWCVVVWVWVYGCGVVCSGVGMGMGGVGMGIWMWSGTYLSLVGAHSRPQLPDAGSFYSRHIQ